MKAVIGLYEDYPDLWKEMFETYPSDRAFEFEDEIRALAPAVEKLEGSSVAQDTMTVKYQTMYKHKTYGTSFSITDEAMNDNLYKNLFPKQAKALAQALRETKNQIAANILNLGNVTTVADGYPLFSAHPIDGGATSSNTTNVALSKIDIQNAITAISQLKQISGTYAQVKAKKLVTGSSNWMVAGILLGSQFRTSVGSANNNAYAGVNDLNMVNHDNVFPQGLYYQSFYYFSNSFLHYHRCRKRDDSL